MSLLSDVFHPLVTPLTTYTYTARDSRAETVSAADRDRLPPGGLNLQLGFPEWYDTSRATVDNRDEEITDGRSSAYTVAQKTRQPSASLTVEVLQYLRIVFDTEAILDTVPLEAAADAGAWHAWRSYRAKFNGGRLSPASKDPGNVRDASSERSSSPRQQPGGARRPGEWNWQGVWEERTRKVIQASISDHKLYGGEDSDVICFSKAEPGIVGQLLASKTTVGS